LEIFMKSSTLTCDQRNYCRTVSWSVTIGSQNLVLIHKILVWSRKL
jgi:hypothetical protein